jgi:hypothetical protein
MYKTVWVVFLGECPPDFVSIHATKESAKAGVVRATTDYRWGGTEDDYHIREILLEGEAS